MQDSLNISVHHIGGRAGTMEFPYFSQEIEKDINRVLYDADDSCLEQVEDRLKSLNKAKILPYCISDDNKTEKFFLVADRYESSLLRPLDKENYFYNMGFGFDLDMRGDVDETIEVEVYSLDNIFKDNSIDTNKPDFLSIDAEGGELKILQGAKDLLKHNILSLKCEFHSFENACEIINFCKEYGFFVSNSALFDNEFEYSKQMPIGLRGAQKGSSQSGDITFLKKSEHIKKFHENPLFSLLKVAFIAFSDNKIDKMYEYIDNMKDSKIQIEQLSGSFTYITLIKELIDTLELYPNIVPLKYSTLFPTSKHRSDRFSNKGSISIDEIREGYFKYVDKELFKANIPVLLNKDFIGIENICLNYNFKEHAEKFKNDRLNSMINLLKRLNLVIIENNQMTLNQEEFNKI